MTPHAAEDLVVDLLDAYETWMKFPSRPNAQRFKTLKWDVIDKLCTKEKAK